MKEVEVEQVDSVGHAPCDPTIGVRVAGSKAWRLRATGEVVVEEIDRVGDLTCNGAVAVTVAAKETISFPEAAPALVSAHVNVGTARAGAASGKEIVAQETMIKAFTSIETLRAEDERSFFAWLAVLPLLSVTDHDLSSSIELAYVAF